MEESQEMPIVSPAESYESDTALTPIVISSAKLFAGRSEVVIEHDGTRYRLRITRRGKLILQK